MGLTSIGDLAPGALKVNSEPPNGRSLQSSAAANALASLPGHVRYCDVRL